MNSIDEYPRCRAYLTALKISGREDGWNDYWSALSVAASYEDKVLAKFGGLDFWTMDGTSLLKRMEQFLDNRAATKPNQSPKNKISVEKCTTKPISEKEIMSAQTSNGGWKQATLAEWGVPWPPPKGWKKTILKHGIPFNYSKR